MQAEIRGIAVTGTPEEIATLVRLAGEKERPNYSTRELLQQYEQASQQMWTLSGLRIRGQG